MPRVGEHLIGQIGRAHGARLDLLNAIPERGLGRRLQKRKAGVTEHADEQVIEVVSDAAGEHTEALELLHLLDLLLEAMPRDLRVFRSWMVVHDDQAAARAAVGRVERLHDRLDMPHRPVTLAEHRLAAPVACLENRGANLRDIVGDEQRREQVRRRPADRFAC